MKVRTAGAASVSAPAGEPQGVGGAQVPRFIAWADLDDGELVSMAGGEPEAFGVVYDRHVKSILAFFYARTRHPELTADLTAETFAQAFESRLRYASDRGSVRNWLLGVASKVLARSLRRGRIEDRARRRLGMQPLAGEDLGLDRCEELLAQAPRVEALRDALGRLNGGMAEVLVLRVGLDMSYAEIAERLGCSEGAARVRVSRGLAKLSQLLEGT